jgi:hypothetical protein
VGGRTEGAEEAGTWSEEFSMRSIMLVRRDVSEEPTASFFKI